MRGRARLAAEVGGRWSQETADFLNAMAKAKAEEHPRILQGRVRDACVRRWSALLACCSARSLAVCVGATASPWDGADDSALKCPCVSVFIVSWVLSCVSGGRRSIHWPDVCHRVFSMGFRKTLPLPASVATSPFVFANTLSVCSKAKMFDMVRRHEALSRECRHASHHFLFQQ